MADYVVTRQCGIEGESYGIALLEQGNEVDLLVDVASDFTRTMQLAVYLHGVAPEHFRDVVEDYMVRWE